MRNNCEQPDFAPFAERSPQGTERRSGKSTQVDEDDAHLPRPKKGACHVHRTRADGIASLSQEALNQYLANLPARLYHEHLSRS